MRERGCILKKNQMLTRNTIQGKYSLTRFNITHYYAFTDVEAHIAPTHLELADPAAAIRCVHRGTLRAAEI